MQCLSASPEQEHISLFSGTIFDEGLGWGQVLSQTDQITSLTLLCFGWIFPIQSHLSPGRLTGLFGLALPLLQFQLLLHMYLSTLVPPLSGTRRGQGDFFLYPIILLVLHMFNVRTSLCCHLDQGRATPLVLHQLCTPMP